MAGSAFYSERLACTHHFLHSHCNSLGRLHHCGLVIHKGTFWLTHGPFVQLQETTMRFWAPGLTYKVFNL